MDNIEQPYKATMNININNNNNHNTISKKDNIIIVHGHSHSRNHNYNAEKMQRGGRSQDNFMPMTFECTNAEINGDDDDNDDNCHQSINDNDDHDDICTDTDSTPYYTPMEFVTNTFNFPSPKLIKNDDNIIMSPLSTPSTDGNFLYHHQHHHNREDNLCKGHIDNKCVSNQQNTRIIQSASGKRNTKITPSTAAKHWESTSPVINHKFRRFSLYERRSCSPQHLIIKNPSTLDSDSFIEIDKENTKPEQQYIGNQKDGYTSDHNSPGIIYDESGSPRILTNAEATMISGGRFPYSPKLLNTLNNLNMNSPLSVVNSVSYKNGNYFKFPEIDQDLTLTSSDNKYQKNDDIYEQNKARSSSRKHYSIDNISPGIQQQLQQSQQQLKKNVVSHTETEIVNDSGNELKNKISICSDKVDGRRNRKNKNNLTIQIINTPLNSEQKNLRKSDTEGETITAKHVKTPTIKSIKEKALSLDSAASVNKLYKGHGNTIPIQPWTSFDEMGSYVSESKPSMVAESICPTSDNMMKVTPTLPLVSSSILSKSNVTESSCLMKNVRRRFSMLTNNDWMGKQYPLIVTVTSSDATITSPQLQKSREDKKMGAVLKENKESSICTNTITTTTTTSTLRTHKHNPLLHSSSTNLKTLPEFLTLVEFSTPTTLPLKQHPFKQKSMDLPRSTIGKGARPPTNTTTSTNLLKRRGSNHSLTLNLHSSCSNLLSNCRTGLSISNCNIGSMATSTNHLNSKSSDNINTNNCGQIKSNIIGTSKTVSSSLVEANQGTKQSLFRRRGSNHSLTLTNIMATSCSNLNSFSSQSSLNVDKLPIMTFQRPSLTNTPRRGLLERRGSNQNLTLNMSSSFGGLSTERITLGHSRLHLGHSQPEEDIKYSNHYVPGPIGSNYQNQRKFYSSENLNQGNTQFADLNQTHKRNANQICFGSVADLKVTDREPDQYSDKSSYNKNIKEPMPRSFQHFDFQETTVCTCTGLRNIQTKPLSPQTTSEEFKVYLANIQMLQNASNALNQTDLIKLNYIFDNSYATEPFKSLTEQQSTSILNIPPNPLHIPIVDSDAKSLTMQQTYGSSEDCEIQERYLEAIKNILDTSCPDDEEQKRIFRNLYKEFWDLPLNHQEKPMVFGSQMKNRYKSILPNENSRVILEKESKFLEELYLIYKNDIYSNIDKDIDNDYEEFRKNFNNDDSISFTLDEDQPYINANYIKGPDYNSKSYIATQGPLPNTIFEFWLMIYQNTIKYMKRTKNDDEKNPQRYGQRMKQYYQKIIMLTNFVENNRQKCSIYLPIELNDIILITNKEEASTPPLIFKEFFQQHFNDDNSFDDDDCQNETIRIRCSKITIPEHLCIYIPRTNSFFIIKNVAIVKKNGFSIRKLFVLYCINVKENDQQVYLIANRFICYHYWYPDWPDHRSPKDINTLLDIALHILNLGTCEMEFETFNNDNITSQWNHIMAHHINLYQQDIFNMVQPLPVIHCSAGIGRTGCLTAILNGIRQVRQSLVYSLTSMAATASTKRHNIGPNLSPVDFCLPKSFLDQYAVNTNATNTTKPTKVIKNYILENFCNEIDCSFTYNTLIYIYYIIQMYENDEPLKQSKDNNKVFSSSYLTLLQLPHLPNIFVDILGIVCNLRLQRGGMVQNSEQYELIHRTICLYLKRAMALKRF